MNVFKIQTPIKQDVFNKIKDKADDLGFSSVNELIRVILKGFADNKYNLEMISEINRDADILNYRSTLDKEVQDALKSYKKGKEKAFDNVEDLMADLND